MAQHVSKFAIRTLCFGAVLAALSQISAVDAKVCPILVGGACHGHGPCDPPEGGVCTDTVTDCVCKKPTAKSTGLLGHLGITIGVGSHSGHDHHRNDTNSGPVDNSHPATNNPVHGQ